MTMSRLSFHGTWFTLPSAFGELILVWTETEAGVRVARILLPGADIRLPGAPGSFYVAPAPIAELGERLQAFLLGQAVDFDLGLLQLDCCGSFQRRVLLAEAAIPRGCVSTYGRIAAHLGAPGAGRAVGNALAQNPFPLVIPCHRAVRADGALGGYQGGLALKRALLAFEGVAFEADGRASLKRLWY